MTCSSNTIFTPDRRWFLPCLAAVVLAMPAAAVRGEGSDPLDMAERAISSGDGIAAEAELRRALAAGLPRRMVAARMGEAEMLQGDLVAARRWLEAGDFAPGEHAYGYRLLGRLEIAEGDLPAAGDAFDQALRTAPDDGDLWVDIGRLRYRGGEQRQAIDAVLHALDLEPNNVRALEFRAELVRDARGMKAALPFLERALKRDPNDLRLLGEYAATLGELGRAREMLAVTRRMLDMDPKNSRAFFLQAVLAARAGKTELARRLLSRTSESYRRIPAATLLAGVIELKARNVTLARDHLERLYRLQPDNEYAQILLARAIWADDKPRELVERFGDRALRADAAPYLKTLVGRAYEVLGDRARAAVYLDLAVDRPDFRPVALPQSVALDVFAARWRSDPTNAANIVPYVRQLIALGRYDDASRIAEEHRIDFPGSSSAQLLSGDAFLASGDPAAALERYFLSAEIRLSRPLLWRMLAAYHELGQDDSAQALLTEYLEQHPRDSRAAARLGRFVLANGDGRGAQKLFQRALDLQGELRDPWLLQLLASAKLQQGNAKGAAQSAVQAYRLQRSSADAAFVLGTALREQGGHESLALRLIAKARRMGVVETEALHRN